MLIKQYTIILQAHEIICLSDLAFVMMAVKKGAILIASAFLEYLEGKENQNINVSNNGFIIP